MTKVFIQDSRDISWAHVLPTLLDYYGGKKSDIVILDVSRFSFPKRKPFPNWILKKYELIDRLVFLQEFMMDYTTHDLADYHWNVLDGGKIGGGVPSFEIEVNGLLCDIFATSNPNRSLLFSRIVRRKVLRLSKEVYLRSFEFFRHYAPKVVIIPNGRFPVQAAIAIAAKQCGLEVKFYELGFQPKESIYLGECDLNDRLSLQENFKAHIRDSKSEVDFLRNAEEWLVSRRVSGSSTNEFAKNFKLFEETDSSSAGDEKYAVVFFSSSQFEVTALNNWGGFGWKDQYEAFLSFGLRVPGKKVLRIHPNFLNKSFLEAFWELLQIIKLSIYTRELKIVWPNDSYNTYTLIQEAKRVVVSNSTVGLEASCVGKPVWICHQTAYDLISDVRTYKPQKIYGDSYFLPWLVDFRISLLYINSFLKNDIRNLDSKSKIDVNESIPYFLRVTHLFKSSPLYFLTILMRFFSRKAIPTLIGCAKICIYLTLKLKNSAIPFL